MSNTDEVEESAMPLIEHLAELRTRLIRSVIAFLIGMVICFTVWNPIFNFLTQPLCDARGAMGDDCGLILIKLQEGFFVAISISLLGGLVLSFPVISYQMWRFVAPGLYRNEQGAFLPFLIASPFMFFLGAGFAFYVVTPLAFDFFLGFQQEGTLTSDVGIDNATAGIAFQGSAQEYLRLTIKFIVAFGLCFQLPVLLTLMGKAGLVSSQGLGDVRKYAVVGILVLAAIVTPPDVITQAILFVVVYGLYEISIWLVRRVERKREAQLRAEGLWVEDDEEGDEDPAAAAHGDTMQQGTGTEDGDEDGDDHDPIFDEFDAEDEVEVTRRAASEPVYHEIDPEDLDPGMVDDSDGGPVEVKPKPESDPEPEPKPESKPGPKPKPGSGDG